MKISRQAYADMYGPTTGDRVRLGDTELWIEVESDATHYGDEVKFGGGKVIRDGMGQSQKADDTVMDTVITNALILDWWGVVKADVGIQRGRIAAIGKAGNPDTQPDVQIVIGPAVRPPEVTEAKALKFQGRGPTISSRRHSDHFSSRRRLDDNLIDGVALAITPLILLVLSSLLLRYQQTARSCQKLQVGI